MRGVMSHLPLAVCLVAVPATLVLDRPVQLVDFGTFCLFQRQIV